jgi:phosphatidylserine/phosphatidylglycerophosphate/cardiolipin synthase-like enzyme
MAERAAAGLDPWDAGCRVTTFVGGLDAMSAMRDSLTATVADAKALGTGQPRAAYGHVYITDWRLNCLRDLSTANDWHTDAWRPSDLSGRHADEDSTAIGLVLQLMQAGVTVRVLLWYPRAITYILLSSHMVDHFYLARVVQEENARLKALWNVTEDIGVVALDVRTTDSVITAAHHQKTMVIRGPQTHVAYVGGVDLAFTRRDAPARAGDWQSGNHMPDPALGWPRATVGVDYTSVDRVPRFTDRMGSDLPENVFGDGDTGGRQMWHDQHLKLEGPVVQTIEQQFVERWNDTTDQKLLDISSLAATRHRVGQVVFSSPNAFDPTGIKKLPDAAPQAAVTGATSLVQMWRTIPWRRSRTGEPFTRAEFTVMAGISRAVTKATELIWMFDQYFWSVPLGRLLNARLKSVQSLHVIVILPPHADSFVASAHRARVLALNALTNGLQQTGNDFDRVAVYNPWLDRTAPAGTPPNRGIYVHAKAHTYDADLLVCGSANLNRRSFLCDTEIDCAVLDPAVVSAHQDALWSDLVPGATRPAVDVTHAGWGKTLFDDLRQTVRAGSSILIDDRWRDATPTLPNGVVRDQSPWLFDIMYPNFLDPTSITDTVESRVFDVGLAAWRDPQLDEIVDRLEAEHVGSFFPYRHS